MASRERAFTVTNGTIHYGAELSSYRYEYDVCNNLTKLTCSVAGATWNTVYTYDDDNRPRTTTTWSGTVLTNTYDSLGRLTKRTIGLGSSYETHLEYWLNGDNRTTLLHRYYNGSDDPYVYGYDDNGNVTSITQGTTSISYEYDAANRLTRENNGVTNETVTYEYDDFGNILNKKFYAYTTGTLPATPASTVTYTYASSGWTDQLVSYNGQAIVYDAMGNPTTYRGYTFTWQGKQLMTSVNGSQTVSFEYNEDGLRQKKTVNGTETDYYYNGSVLIGMQRSGTRYLFSYDASGKVVSVKYNNNEYYYVRNGQGDIVKLIDSTGTTVVEYTYDTWGKKVTTTGSLAGTLGLIQPFRYRGYVYDYETGFYYLESRYYDPTTGRFISSDVLLSTGQGVLGHNAYAYCLDNPVMLNDLSGMKASELVCFSTRGDDKYGSSYSESLRITIQRILEKDIYSSDRWDTLSREHRLNLLKQLFRDVSYAMDIDECEIVFVDEEYDFSRMYYDREYFKKELNGYSVGATIFINVMAFDISHERLKTVVHEIRHVYQYLVCRDSIDGGRMSAYESASTIELWKGNIPQFGGIYYSSGPEYRNQPIEKDAFWFTCQN